MVHKLEEMERELIEHVECQIEDIYGANYEELGAAVDMIKDLAETIYYHTVTEAMEGKEYSCKSEWKNVMKEEEWNEKDGRSPTKRRKYMEAKEAHMDEAHRMKELESYMQELALDIADMIKDASLSEKQLLQKKITALATKIE